MCPDYGFRVSPPSLELGVRELDDAALSIEPPAFLLVFNERKNALTGQAIFRRHSLHFTLPQSDEAVVEGGQDRSVCFGKYLIGRGISFRTCGEALQNTVAKQIQVPSVSANPNSSLRIRGKTAGWNL